MSSARARPSAPALLAAAAPALLLALLALATGGLLWATGSPDEKKALIAGFESRFALVLMVWLFAAMGLGALAQRLWGRWGAAQGRLAEQVQVLLAAERPVALAPGTAEPALQAAIDALAAQRDRLRAEIAERVAEGSRAVEQEKSRLAALMAELTQSVVVCNLEGRILLFNARARLQLRALAGGGAAAIGGAEAVALGRSIYALLDRRLVAHALEAVQQRLARGAANPSAPFVTSTAGGQLLRVQLAPVRESGAAADAPLNGFVLMLDNVTREMAESAERDRVLHELTEGSRGALGNLQAAVELLDDPGLEPAIRERFFAVVREEIGSLSRRLNEASSSSALALKTRWPLEDMLGADLAAAAARRIETEAGARTSLVEVDTALWLKVDSYTLIQALVHLARHLHDDLGHERLQLRLLAPAEGRAQAALDLVWSGQAISTETVVAWETEPLAGAGTALTLREVVERHGGAFWFERERVRQQAFFRFLLPPAAEAHALEAAALVKHESRPEFYDFDLFQAHGGGVGRGAEVLQRPLAELSYTVFDTETTGLEPSQGDKIIQIGATRIVAGKLRRRDCFEQLVDPERGMSEASIAIHGIQPEMLKGQPTIATVLPAFADFAADTVLVAHNAAFDMRFLQLQEEATGVKFEVPVLDTLLLSAVLHPQQESHRLEAIAERLGVELLGRHTALGDAIVTAEVFLKMLPLLQAAGVHTLAQALEASRQTYLARVSY